MTIGNYLELSHPERRSEQAEAQSDATAADRAAGIAALFGVAREIRACQERLKPAPSDRAFVNQYPDLGSTTTYQKLRDGAEERDPDVWLPKYSGVLASLRLAAMAAPGEEIYEDLAPARAIHSAVLRLARACGKDRLVVIEGPSGSGKTESLRIEARRQGGAMVLVDADETWKSPRVALGDILRALGESDIPGNTVGCRDRLIALCGARQYVIAIDEGHHACASVLNMIKTMINRTSVRILIAAQGTLWRKLTAIASEEAMQLLHNRLNTRVQLHAPTPAEAGAFLSRRLGFERPLPVAMLADTAKAAAGLGHYAFLRRVADHLAAEEVRAGLAPADLVARISAATIAARQEVAGN